MKTPDWLDWKIWLWSVLFNRLKDFTLMKRTSLHFNDTIFLAGEAVHLLQMTFWWLNQCNPIGGGFHRVTFDWFGKV